MNQRLSAWLLVVEVSEAKSDSCRDAVERERPVVVEIVIGCRDEKILQGSPCAQLNDQSQLIRPVFPTGADQVNEVFVFEWSHEHQLMHDLLHHFRCNLGHPTCFDRDGIQPEDSPPHDPKRPVRGPKDVRLAKSSI